MLLLSSTSLNNKIFVYTEIETNRTVSFHRKHKYNKFSTFLLNFPLQKYCNFFYIVNIITIPTHFLKFQIFFGHGYWHATVAVVLRNSSSATCKNSSRCSRPGTKTQDITGKHLKNLVTRIASIGTTDITRSYGILKKYESKHFEFSYKIVEYSKKRLETYDLNDGTSKKFPIFFRRENISKYS